MKPTSLSALIILAALAAGPACADPLTDLVDRYVAWRGGPRFEQLRTIHERGTLVLAGLSGSLEVWLDRDGRRRDQADLGAVKFADAMSATDAWDTMPSGEIETMSTSDNRNNRRNELLEFGDALRGRGGATATFAGTERRNGRDWAVVRARFGDADIYDAFIDPATGELDGWRITEDRKTRFESKADWRTVDGVRMPFLQTTTTDVPGGDQTVRLATVELNRPIAAALFDRPAQVKKVSFAGGVGSTGWIDFEFFGGNRIYFPARVNGHPVVVLLDSGAESSAIDRTWAASIGLTGKGGFTAMGSGGVDTAGVINGVQVEVGNLTLKDLTVASLDFGPVAAKIGHPLPFVLGNEMFSETAVDIDFAHHRIAFRDPSKLTKPDGAIEIPLASVKGIRSIPVSVEGRPPVQFDFDLGNGSPLLIFPAYYQSQHLLDGRRATQVLGGAIGGIRPQGEAVIRRIDIGGVAFDDVPTQFMADVQSGVNSDLTLGNVGLPILSRFHLVVDYSHDRLIAIPDPQAVKAPFAKDRLGLELTKDAAEFTVAFVSPGGPAEAAGFKAKERVRLIDGRPADAWPKDRLTRLTSGAAGTEVAFTLDDGVVRRVRLADYF